MWETRVFQHSNGAFGVDANAFFDAARWDNHAVSDCRAHIGISVGVFVNENVPCLPLVAAVVRERQPLTSGFLFLPRCVGSRSRHGNKSAVPCGFFPLSLVAHVRACSTVLGDRDIDNELLWRGMPKSLSRRLTHGHVKSSTNRVPEHCPVKATTHGARVPN